ncbi:hypothetical protein AN958_02950 [Leucoagaricus sp. SymC.cos]|nr:hypothetical protein AN958_02950 [Leucoagaricus sp. SymC.cos]
MTLKKEKELNTFIDKNLKSGRIHISKSQYAAPCFFILKLKLIDRQNRSIKKLRTSFENMWPINRTIGGAESLAKTPQPAKPKLASEMKKLSVNKLCTLFTNALKSKLRPSAQAQNTMYDNIGLVDLAKAFSALFSDCIAMIYYAANSMPAPAKCKLSSTSASPTCCQILVLLFNSGDIVKLHSLLKLI